MGVFHVQLDSRRELKAEGAKGEGGASIRLSALHRWVQTGGSAVHTSSRLDQGFLQNPDTIVHKVLVILRRESQLLQNLRRLTYEVLETV